MLEPIPNQWKLLRQRLLTQILTPPWIIVRHIPPVMSEESAMKKIDEDAKEFSWFFTDLPPKFRSKVVEKRVSR
jgi:hypothetical protein